MYWSQTVVVHAFNPSTWEVYKVSSRIAWAIERNPVLKKQNKTKEYVLERNLLNVLTMVKLLPTVKKE